MRREDIDAQLAAKRSSQQDSYNQVEQHIKELQERMADVASPSASLVGEVETREERYERHQRLESRRREFQQSAQIPLSKRIRPQPFTALALISIMVFLFIAAFFGGSIATSYINQRPTIDAVETSFWHAMLINDYYTAQSSIDPRVDTPQRFNNLATVATQAMGHITGYQKVSATAQGTSTYVVTYKVKRSGGDTVKQPTETTVILRYYLNPNVNKWYIVDLGTLVTIPQ